MASGSSHGGQRRNIHENILKQGYLKKCMAPADLLPSVTTQLASSIKQKFEPNRWYVFGVRNSIPFLEYYEKEEKIFTGRAIETYDLSTYENLSYTMGQTNTNFSFCIYLSESTIDLMAPNRGQMIDWCNCLRRHLHNLGLRTRNAKGDHTYSEFPVKPKPPTRSPQPDDYLFETPVTTASAPFLDSIEDSEDALYSDPLDLLPSDNNNNRHSNNKCPVPPPRHQKAPEEDVFVYLRSVTRITKEREMDYQNLKDSGENSDHTELKNIGVDAGALDDSLDTESELENGEINERKHKNLGAYANKKELIALKTKSDPIWGMVDLNDESINKCASLPIINRKGPDQLDTSEDSDFIPASFWLRNKMTDKVQNGSSLKNKTLPNPPIEESDNPPPLPERDTTLERKVKESKLHLKRDSDFSSDMSTDEDGKNDKACDNKDDLNDGRSTVIDSFSDAKRDVDDGSNDDDADKNENAEDKVEIAHLGFAPDPPELHTNWMSDPVYTETLVSETKTRIPFGHSVDNTYLVKSVLSPNNNPTFQKECSSASVEYLFDLTDEGICLPKRKLNLAQAESRECFNPTQNGIGVSKNELMDNAGTYETLVEVMGETFPTAEKGACGVETSKAKVADADVEIYETAWEANSKLPSEPEKFEKPEKLRVDLPSSNDCFTTCKPQKAPSVPQSNDAFSVPKRLPTSQSVKERVTKLLSRKSQSRELPENLSVSIDKTGFDQNFYSDMPDGSGADGPPEPDSDILRIAREKNPIKKLQTSPVLPKRSSSTKERQINMQQPPKNTAVITPICKGSGMSQSLEEGTNFYDDLESYEPMSKSSGPELETAWPPSPPARNHRNKKTGQFGSSDPEIPPVAPPRRNRNTVCVPEASFARFNHFPEKPPVPVRKMSAGFTDSKLEEPIIPPRDYVKFDDKRPPPPRPRMEPTRQASLEGARPRQVHHAAITNLKQNQADTLRIEIDTPGGITLIIQKSHFQHGIAFVECFEQIWIAGWDQNHYPRLYDKFHIGDQLLSINDVQCTDLAFAHKLIKNVKAESIEVTVRRLPHGKVFAIQRTVEGENLGIKREGGTAEIVYVDPLGLAYRHGLTKKSPTLDNTGQCNWVLTEINMRPLNLFFKDQEIEHRLMAVGKDISIVVQPQFFIKELKKQLKRIRGYKDFLVQ